jgi:hypothetical protein
MEEMFRFILYALILTGVGAQAEVNCLTRGHGHTILSLLSARENQPILANFKKVLGPTLTRKLTRLKDSRAGSLIIPTAGKRRQCESSFFGAKKCTDLVDYQGKFILNGNTVGELSVENNGLTKEQGAAGDNHLIYVEKLCADGKTVDLIVGREGLKIQLRSFGSLVNAQVGYLKGSQKDLTNETTVAAFDFKAGGPTPIVPNSDVSSPAVAEQQGPPDETETANSQAPAAK